MFLDFDRFAGFLSLTELIAEWCIMNFKIIQILYFINISWFVQIYMLKFQFLLHTFYEFTSTIFFNFLIGSKQQKLTI